MKQKRSERLFNLIAPVYGLFYNYQRNTFIQVLQRMKEVFDPGEFRTLLDIGSGTGALASVLSEQGLRVTALEPAQKMLHIALKKPQNNCVDFVQGDVLSGLPFKDKSFDVSIASYVAHGLHSSQRSILYSEMSRVTRSLVIIHDYNAKRGLLTDIAETLEQGDYFQFIQVALEEMESATRTTAPSKLCFSQVHVHDLGGRAAWYVCAPL